MSKLIIILFVSSVYGDCYWNSNCPFNLFGSKTPYDTVRGDIRDYEIPDSCEAVSIWTINRHGNRNPGTSVSLKMKGIVGLKDEIIASYEQKTSQLCAQDIDNFRKWKWNSTLDTSPSFLTGIGYEELYDLGKRLRQKYGHLLNDTADQYFFRPTKEQRTVTSCMAFVHGLTDGLNLDVIVEDPWKRDDIIRPYQNCDRYQKTVKEGPLVVEQLDSYTVSPDFLTVQDGVRKRLGIKTEISADVIFAMYEMCRFHRSWAANLQDPWCAVFTDEDLNVMEYYDDVKHYYRNGYGSWVNEVLGQQPLKDLYENFEAVVNGQGKKVISYFTHDTMMEMMWCALGLYKDDMPLDSLNRNPERQWRSSFIGALSTNLIAVLNSCNETGNSTFRVQFFINEDVTPLCPVDGCTWEEFKESFQIFSQTSLAFCDMDYQFPATNSPVTDRPVTESPVTASPVPNSASTYSNFLRWY